MKIHRIDHVGIIVNDLPAAKAFFLDFGLEMLEEGKVEGEWVERVTTPPCLKAGASRVSQPI